MRYQKPHDASGRQGVFISVEAQDSTYAWVRGDIAIWHLADASVGAGFQTAPRSYNTRGYRVELAAATATEEDVAHTAAGIVESVPSVATTNLNTTRHGEVFELQVWGFHDAIQSDVDAAEGIVAGVPFGLGKTTAGKAGHVTALTVDTIPGFCGIAFDAVAGGASTPFAGFIRLM